MDDPYFDLATGDVKKFISDRLPNAVGVKFLIFALEFLLDISHHCLLVESQQ